MAKQRNTPESRALMVHSDSDSDSDVTEFGAPRRNGTRTNGITKTRIQRACDYCPVLTTTQLALVLSVVINIILFIVLLWTATGYFFDVCTKVPSENATTASLESNNSSSELNEHLTPPSVSQVTDATPQPTPQQTALPAPPPVSSPCVTSQATCGTASERVKPETDPHYVNIFRDLTSSEITAAVRYVSSQREFRISFGNVIFGVELYPPEKSAALAFLDSGGAKPPREALVTVVFKNANPQVVRQYVVGALPTPTYHKRNPRMSKDVPAKYLATHMNVEMVQFLYRYLLTPQVQRLLAESFGATFTNCGTRCLMPLATKTSFGLVNTTTLTFATYYKTEFPTIQPLPFQVIVQGDESNQFSIKSVYYAGATFNSVDELLQRYNQGTIFKEIKRQFPVNAPGEDSIPGSLNLRGARFPAQPHAPPHQYEPRGPRYSIVDQHVKYLQWSFNLRQSIESGPQLWDIRWGGERVVYELSLQEVAVLYAGANPSSMFSHLSDSAFGLGDAARGLVPGVDCPEHATFLSIHTWDRHTHLEAELPNALCVFEHNSGVPLRRHRSGVGKSAQYGGLVDYVLIVRTIIVEYNYDYIFDFVFHLNGALEARVYATGYIMSQWYHYGESPFGFNVHEDVVGSIHHHLFNFKVDMDIGGTSNRYETLDFTVDDREWPWLHILKPNSSASSSSSSSNKIEQIAFKRHLRKTEQDAVYHYNFDQPKYHIFYNRQVKNKFDNPRAYRIEGKGFSKQILPHTHPAVRSRKWMQYQMAVTSRKEDESKSSSIFSMYDGDNPTADLEEFLKDDESILDQDLVTWVTLGMHHIPHTEDIPNTPTPGTEAAILLLPYNYFPECPSMGSRDADLVTWVTLGMHHIPHTEDIPNTPTPGTEAAILLLPYNYFPECPSMGSRDAVRLDRAGSATSYKLYGAETELTCKPKTYNWMTDPHAKTYP